MITSSVVLHAPSSRTLLLFMRTYRSELIRRKAVHFRLLLPTVHKKYVTTSLTRAN